MSETKKNRYYQKAVFTLNDKRVVVFTGPAVFWPVHIKSGLRITDIQFTNPKPLPKDMNWGDLK